MDVDASVGTSVNTSVDVSVSVSAASAITSVDSDAAANMPVGTPTFTNPRDPSDRARAFAKCAKVAAQYDRRNLGPAGLKAFDGNDMSPPLFQRLARAKFTN